MSLDASISVSVVVPVYSGEAFLPELIKQLEKVRAGWHDRGAPMELAEVIFVNDAAIDGSADLLDQIAEEHPWVTVVHMMRNFGQHAATIAGVLHSSGDWVVTLDEDLQHPPAEIEALLKQAVLEGGDIVYARPARAVHESFFRDWGSRGFKRLMVALTGNPNVVHFNSFRLLRGSLARAASSVCGHETYFDVALSWFTKRIRVRLLDLKDRRFISSGNSGYTFARLLSHARRMVLSSHVKIIHVFGALGMLIVAGSLVGAGTLFLANVFHSESIPVTGWTSLMLTNLFFGGFITCMVALTLEYISTLVLAAHGKPIFFAVDRSLDERLARYFVSEKTWS